MSLHDSVMDLQDEVSLVLVLYDGKGFIQKIPELKSLYGTDTSMELTAVAGLNSVLTQESDPVDFTTLEPFFNTQLEWSMTKQIFQDFRKQRVPLNVQFFITFSKLKESDTQRSESKRQCIGNIMFDLKEALPISTSQISDINKLSGLNASYATKANWKMVEMNELARTNNPFVRCTLCLEPNLTSTKEMYRTLEQEFAPITSHKSLHPDQELALNILAPYSSDMLESSWLVPTLIPILKEDKGFFLLGKEEEATEMYYFNVFITYGKNLQRATSLANAGASRQEARYYLSYNLFGVDILTEKFKILHDQSADFLPEKASARILTSCGSLEKFFNEVCKDSLLEIDLCTESSVLACCYIDISNTFTVSKERLKRPNLIEYEGVAFMDPVSEKDSNNSLNVSSTVKRSKLFSDSSVEKPHIGFRLSIGKYKDNGLDGEKSLDLVDLEDNEDYEASFTQKQPLLTQAELSIKKSCKRHSEDIVSKEISKSPRSDTYQTQIQDPEQPNVNVSRDAENGRDKGPQREYASKFNNEIKLALGTNFKDCHELKNLANAVNKGLNEIQHRLEEVKQVTKELQTKLNKDLGAEDLHSIAAEPTI